jgi:hypothetical protein
MRIGELADLAGAHPRLLGDDRRHEFVEHDITRIWLEDVTG